ncbi:hypothetical protein L484_016888 [Morus notabilis]|uniref:Calcineurin-like phosphoesterase domain-containing protein n=1 Tax=Morus notabilis TaxID=981085 RepID=W9RTU7_9ROSA|nr:hypothetical protein L484_016888 [Morus notabilis]
MIVSLGDAHVAYQCLDFPMVKLSVVGGRPFSCGGQKVFPKRLLSARCMSAETKYLSLYMPWLYLREILLVSNLDDICGKDWGIGDGDHGDPDLEQAISLLKDSNKVSVPLVVFGHMHERGLRKMIVKIVVGSDDTIYLNGANIVPRVRTLINEQAKEGSSNSFTKD